MQIFIWAILITVRTSVFHNVAYLKIYGYPYNKRGNSNPVINNYCAWEMGDQFASSVDSDSAGASANQCMAIVPVGPVRTITNYGDDYYTNSNFNEITKRGATNFVGLLNQLVFFFLFKEKK